MNEPDSPFDIPLIIDLIGGYLRKSDYANCILVSKDFYDKFQCQLWRDIEKRARPSQYKSKIPFYSTHARALLENGHRIPKLGIFEEGCAKLLEFIAKTPFVCTNILEFECSTFQPYGNLVSLLRAIINITRRNKSLRKCSFERFGQGIKIGDYQVFQSSIDSSIFNDSAVMGSMRWSFTE